MQGDVDIHDTFDLHCFNLISAYFYYHGGKSFVKIIRIQIQIKSDFIRFEILNY